MIRIGAILDRCLQKFCNKHGTTITFGESLNAEFARDLDLGRCLCVADVNTAPFIPNGAKKVSILPNGALATMKSAESLVMAGKDCDTFLGFGGGTITDLCKLCARLACKTTTIFITCPSVNAFSSPTSSIILENDEKVSLNTTLPKKIFCDYKILDSCPTKLTASGFGDFISAESADMDYFLSHLICKTPYNSSIWDIILPARKWLYANAAKLLVHNHDAISILTKLLLIQGFMAAEAGGSHPISQGEHQIGHCIEQHLRRLNQQEWLHGEVVSITTRTMLQIQDTVLNGNRAPYAECRNITLDYLASNNLSHETALEKIRMQTIASKCNWQKIVLNAKKHRQCETEDLHQALNSIGLPTSARPLNISTNLYNAFCERAPFTRNRFGALDLEKKFTIEGLL